MKIVKLKAGLGNQMFQYAFCKLLETQFGVEDVLVDISYFDHKNYRKYLDSGLKKLSLTYNTASRDDLKRIRVPYNNFQPHHFLHRFVAGLQAIFNRHYYFEKNREYVDVQTILNYSYFDGYWQSWRYLEPIKDILLKDFQPKEALSRLTKDSIERYRQLNSVFIGVRRGDYAKSTKAQKMWGTPSAEYYEKALEIIKKEVEDPYFIIFSDDVDWVKQNLGFEKMVADNGRIEYRDKEKIFNNFEEMFVMSSCKHAVISNSTFNFWGAWMIDNPTKIVIAPKQWFKNGQKIDIIPPTWIQI